MKWLRILVGILLGFWIAVISFFLSLFLILLLVWGSPTPVWSEPLFIWIGNALIFAIPIGVIAGVIGGIVGTRLLIKLEEKKRKRQKIVHNQ